jgi:signal peptide peptidase SppA
MRLERLQRFSATPWAISPHALRALCASTSAIPQSKIEFDGARDETEVDDGVAIIPISGIIDKDITPIDALFGSVDVEDIRETLALAMEDETVKGIVLDFDSPGGVVTGVPELAEYVAECSKEKPIVAFTDSMMCSAAYWLAAGASAVVASPSSEVGSIGVYLPVMDVTGAFDQMGIKMDVIKSGDLKAAGFPGTSLTDDQRADLQAGVDDVAAMFKGHVSAHRKVDAGAMRGQGVMGASGVKSGLLDSVGMLWDATAIARRLGAMLPQTSLK